MDNAESAAKAARETRLGKEDSKQLFKISAFKRMGVSISESKGRTLIKPKP